MGGIVGSTGSGAGVGVITVGVLGVTDGLEVWLGVVEGLEVCPEEVPPETWEECDA